MTPQQVAVIRAALESMPAQCRYHGDKTAPSERDRLYRREACCDTGIPAQRRKLAEQALETLRPRAGAGSVVVNVQPKPDQVQVVFVSDPRMRA